MSGELEARVRNRFVRILRQSWTILPLPLTVANKRTARRMGPRGQHFTEYAQLSVHRRPVRAAEAVRTVRADSTSHNQLIEKKGHTSVSQSLTPTTSNTRSPTWVFAYQLPLAFDPLKELAKVQYVTACPNGGGMFPPVFSQYQLVINGE